MTEVELQTLKCRYTTTAFALARVMEILELNMSHGLPSHIRRLARDAVAENEKPICRDQDND